MRIAAKVRAEKEQHPERFCADRRCLWRVQHPGQPDTPCAKHHTHTPATTTRIHSRMIHQTCACGYTRYVEQSGPRKITGRWFHSDELLPPTGTSITSSNFQAKDTP